MIFFSYLYNFLTTFHRRRDQGRDLLRDRRQRYRYHRIHAQIVPVPVSYLICHSLVLVSRRHERNAYLTQIVSHIYLYLYRKR